MAMLMGALSACSAGLPQAPTTSVQSMTSATGEQFVGDGMQTIRFGGVPHQAKNLHGWIGPLSKTKPLIYGSSYDGGFINIYDAAGSNQKPIGQLTAGLTSPQGILVDKHHRLWVANTKANNVVAFKRGVTTPFATLNDQGYYPVAVAIDSHGTIYAANAESTSGSAGNVTFWKRGSNPSGTLTFSDFKTVLGVGINRSDDVYVCYLPTSGSPKFVVFPAGSNKANQLSMIDVGGGDLTFDSEQNLVSTDEYGGMGIWAPPYSGAPARKLIIYGNEPTLDKNNSGIWIAYPFGSAPTIKGYLYSSGVWFDSITAGFTSGAEPYGVALDPPAKL